MDVGADRAWIEGRNPFKLAKPAAWWLAQVHAYDAELVVIPSVKDCTYRLTRRVQTHNRQGLSALATVHGHPDTVQMATYGLIPVTTLLTWAVRSDPHRVIRDLMARDTLRHRRGENTDTLVSDLEYREELAKRRQERQAAADLDAINGEAFRSMQFRNGSAVSHAGDSGRPSLEKALAKVKAPKDFRNAFDFGAHKTVISRPSSGTPSPAPLVTLS